MGTKQCYQIPARYICLQKAWQFTLSLTKQWEIRKCWRYQRHQNKAFSWRNEDICPVPRCPSSRVIMGPQRLSLHPGPQSLPSGRRAPSTRCSINVSSQSFLGPNTWFHVVIYSSLVVFMFVRFTPPPTRWWLSKAQREDLCFSCLPKYVSDGHETKWPTKHQSMDKKGWCCAKPVPQATPTHTKKSQVTGTAGKTYSEAILLKRNLPGHLMWMESYSMSRKSKSIGQEVD